MTWSPMQKEAETEAKVIHTKEEEEEEEHLMNLNKKFQSKEFTEGIACMS